MKLKQIYLNLLVVFGLAILGLWIYGFFLKKYNNNNLFQNNHPPTEQNQSFEEISKYLEELKKTNEAQINENNQRNQQIEQLTQQIKLNLDLISDFNVELKNLITTKEDKENNLQNKDLKEEETPQLQQEIISLNEKIQEINDKKEPIHKQTLELIEQKKQLLTTKSKSQEQIKTTTSQINKTSNNLFIIKKIQTLQKAMSLNYANKNIIKDLMIQNKDNTDEFQKLKSYDLFLDGQLIHFDKQIKQLQDYIQAIKNNISYQPPKQKVMFSDVYGMEREKEELEDLIEYFQDDDLDLVNFDKVTPRGYLLYGPPGTGKTHLMKALCGEANVHFINLIPSKFRQKYVGEGEKAVEKVWQEAELYDKAIIFIDEIEGLENRDDSNISSGGVNVINTLLDKLDGFEISDKKIVLIGATNYLDKIDKALRSRFSKEIKIDLLKDDEIEGFLQFLVADYKISYHAYIHLKEIANKCKGKNYSTRDLKDKIINLSLLKSKKYKRKNPQTHEVMLPSDLDEAINTFQNVKISDTEKKTRRKECEDQYVEWKQGLLKYLTPSKDNTQVNRKYIFYGLAGLGNGQYPEYEPTDLATFCKNPFNEWHILSFEYDPGEDFTYFHTNLKYKDSQFNDQMIVSPSNHYIELNYKGPKYLLEEDKDFFMDEVNCPTNKKDEDNHVICKTYYLHFNPVKQYLTLYTKKFNTKENINK
ncbi:AAA family ATPase ['Chrysanthemum coronarium' phytoplasma]|uniref:ATP-dependent Zn proteases n=1 Tax='Chrysanthemum coronarium' phytoplasma TaxID=1520703 RepID=A0ABQ0J2D9_9MOLU|nr:AAA family ATPase ['Chrysanthemum coronarium' phytoplasma]GAK73771.1 ATP-dependent Zn proteases ['Chrysanthemum coronarium' phytoplasma]